LPWQSVLAASIRLARTGHRVGPTEAAALSKAWPALKQDARALSLFAGSGKKSPKASAWVKRTVLADVLERIAREGQSGFYRGTVAESIVRALGDSPQLSLDDLAQYRARWRAPRRVEYRGLAVETMPLPSAGGVALTESLLMLDRQDISKFPSGSEMYVHLLLEIERRADRDRVLRTIDPDALTESQLTALERRYSDPHTWDAYPIDPKRTTPQLGGSKIEVPRESATTTHYSIVDAEGMLVSATTTLSAAFGANIVTDTGVVLNNTLASFSQYGLNQPHSGQRTTSSMAPTLVFDEAGPVMVLGTPGGDSIPSTLLEVTSNLVDFAMTLPAAIDAPRFHQAYAPDRARYETSHPLSANLRRKLEKMGHSWNTDWPKQGHANCILLANGVQYGYADPREGGLALAAAKPQTKAE